MNWFFLTVGYSGLFPKAPGTMGTIASLPLGIAILLYFGPQTLFLATILITLIAIKSIDKHESTSNEHDDSRIVIDELVGMWFALSIAPGIGFDMATLMHWENGIALQIALSFIFFRIYDIKKPSIIGRIDREAKGGIGVMGDDIIAGFAAGISSALVWQIILKSGLIG
ncbi:phosphatidylglycerophosphatase [Sulfuricurvum kujiense DSM 16994]|uniref:Phosphatidylglycerophosphatase n=1 Tax=Sulfuricurvum kujiense (strain ATCC BAA-921 / DSM 16994 / JCM 11577 / YK-1) TaxID=709032 RepID=E4U0U2_SULKY|nr:phosphatidylglycerophosphatase A [Sulfuricurvum kujiense]ADR33318.1 phosphatidylglycerophosphatase [Sulfuricurvum kujiense DSM 16994]